MSLEIKKEVVEVSINYITGLVSVVTREILVESNTNEVIKNLYANRTTYEPSSHRKSTLLDVLDGNAIAIQSINALWTDEYMTAKQQDRNDARTDVK